MKPLAAFATLSTRGAGGGVVHAWLRWLRAQREIAGPSGRLTRIVTRLCLDRLKSARAGRESYVGPSGSWFGSRSLLD